MRPLEPPSIFPGIPDSCLVTPSTKRRTTTRSSSSARNTLPDEIDSFLGKDLLVPDKTPERFACEQSLLVYKDGPETIIQS